MMCSVHLKFKTLEIIMFILIAASEIQSYNNIYLNYPYIMYIYVICKHVILSPVIFNFYDFRYMIKKTIEQYNLPYAVVNLPINITSIPIQQRHNRPPWVLW